MDKKKKSQSIIKKPRKILLKNWQSPGDILMLTATVRDLKLSHPKIEVGIHTSCKEIWENNPYITELNEDDEDVEIIKMDYPLVHNSNEGQHHFIHGFRYYLEKKLGLRIKPTKFKGDIHISEQEKSWINQIEEMGVKDKFWIIMAGGKNDFTCAAEGQRVQTKEGYKRIEDIDFKDEILTEWGFKTSQGSTFIGNKECLNIKTKLGSIIVTSNHRFKIIDIDGGIRWKSADRLKQGDYILCKRGNAKKINVEEYDIDKWFAIGRLWGDGYIHKNRCYWIFSEDDKDSKRRVERWLLKNKLNYSIKERPPSVTDAVKRTKMDYRISVKNPFNKKELPPFKSRGKWREDGFPDIYFYLDYNNIKSFIEGLFSADGTISNGNNGKSKGHITYTTIYNNFGEDVRKMLWQVGITSTIKEFEFESVWGKTCSGVIVSLIGTVSRNNFSEIGFYESYKNDRMNKLNCIEKISPNDKFHGIPFADNLIKNLKTKKNIGILKRIKSYRIKGDLKKSNIIRDSRISNLFDFFEKNENLKTITHYVENNWYFDQITNIVEVGSKRVYDIINSETESYVIEGFVSHNCKWWSSDYYQKVVDYFHGKITFVQCGEKHHHHPQLKNVINLIGKTDLRQFIRLIYHSIGVLCPVTFAMHAAVAIESKHGLLNRPCVVIAGGREPAQWEAYPHHRFLATNGALKCCDNGGCWKSRCHKIGDGDKKDDDEELCLCPVKQENGISIPKCLYMIKPQDVIRAIEMYYIGGVLQYNSNQSASSNITQEGINVQKKINTSKKEIVLSEKIEV